MKAFFIQKPLKQKQTNKFKIWKEMGAKKDEKKKGAVSGNYKAGK